MSASVCLRCDWEGAVGGRDCPRCGARLYRSAPSSPTKRTSGPASAERANVRPRPQVQPDARGPETPAGGPDTRSRPIVALVIVAVLGFVVVGSWLQSHTSRPAAHANHPAPSGTLVYAVDDGPGWSRLWRLDLATSAVVRGPRIHRAVALVDAFTARPGWIGVTSSVGRSLEAAAVRIVGPQEPPVPLAEGDLVGWGPSGGSVVAATRGPSHGCRRELSIEWVDFAVFRHEVQLYKPAFCGDLLSVGRDLSTTYFTLRTGHRVSIFYAGDHARHLVLRDHVLLSVSPASDLLVAPPGRGGVSLFFQGIGNRPPLRYGIGGDRLRVDAVLAWSPDARTALVAGEIGVGRGLFAVDVGPGKGIRAPRFVGLVYGQTFATYATDGRAFVLTHGQVFSIVDGRLRPLALPLNAPAPSGPIVWTR